MGFTTDKLIANIQKLMANRGIANVTELAKLLRVPQPTMHRLLSGDMKEPKYPLVKAIADYFKISVPDLVEGSIDPAEGMTPTATPVRMRGVPVVGGAQLGDEGYWTNLQYPVGYGDGTLSWPSQDPDVYALRCTGDSMKPRIKDGEYVVVEPNHSYQPGDEVLVVTQDDRAMVKTFLYERDGFIMLMSINEEHLPIKLPSSDLVCIQYVAGIAKSSLYTPL